MYLRERDSARQSSSVCASRSISRPAKSGGVKAEPGQERDAKLDIVGSLLLLVAMAGLIVALNEAPTYGWFRETKPLTFELWTWPLGVSMPFVLGLVSVVLWIVFGLYERKRNLNGKAAVLDFSLFESRSFRIGLIGGFLFFLGSFAAILVIPQFVPLQPRIQHHHARSIVAAHRNRNRRIRLPCRAYREQVRCAGRGTSWIYRHYGWLASSQ